MFETDKVLSEDQGEVVAPQTNEDINNDELEVKEQPNVDIEDVEEDDFEESETSDEDVETAEEVAELQSKKNQSHQENAQFKKMRLQAKEEAERELAETRKQIEIQRLALEQKISEQNILNEYLNPRKIYDYADQEGISEEHARKMLQFEAEKLINAEKLKVRENFDTQQNIKRELQKDVFFKDLESEVDEIMRHNPDADYRAVYYHQKGLKAEELYRKNLDNNEKRIVANMHDRARRKNIGGSQGSDDTTAPTSILSNEGLELANAFGNDPRNIARYVKSQNKKGR